MKSAFLDKVQWGLERMVNRHREKVYKKKTTPKTFKSEAIDWICSFLFAIVFISLLNMWACQQFIVPTGSMEPTVDGGDRVIVNKRSYGTELYSYGPKRSDKTPERGDVITFYNPEYASDGAFVESLRDFLFLGTLSLVNLNKDKNGNPLEKMFIKRSVGLPGDTVKFKDGDVYIHHFGVDGFKDELSDIKSEGVDYTPHRIISKDSYGAIRAYARASGYRELGIVDRIPSYIKDELEGIRNLKTMDYYEGEKEIDNAVYTYEPFRTDVLTSVSGYQNGIYVKQGHILPLGDNRDNSGDGRFFGSVSTSSINGRALCVAFPPKHIKGL